MFASFHILPADNDRSLSPSSHCSRNSCGTDTGRTYAGDWGQTVFSGFVPFTNTTKQKVVSSHSFQWKYLMSNPVWAFTCYALKLSFPPYRSSLIMLIAHCRTHYRRRYCCKIIVLSKKIMFISTTHKQNIFQTPLPVSERRVRSGAGEGWLCTDQLLSQLLLPEPAAFCTTFVSTNNAAF